MYIVYNQDHEVKMVTDLPVLTILMEIRAQVLDGEQEHEVKWNKSKAYTQVFTRAGMYTIQRYELGSWIR